VQEIGERLLPIEIIVENGRPSLVVMTQAAPVFGKIVEDVDGLAHSLGLSRRDLALDRIPAQVVSTGAGHLMVPIRDGETVDKVRPRAGALLAVLRSVEGQGCYVFSLNDGKGLVDTYARFFNPTVGILEDPATGSAAGPLACHLAAHNLLPQGSMLVEQGTAMGRTSFIRARLVNGTVQVSGGGVIVAEGVLNLR
jgi:PhzF family phenazine biosynthesis protein